MPTSEIDAPRLASPGAADERRGMARRRFGLWPYLLDPIRFAGVSGRAGLADLRARPPRRIKRVSLRSLLPVRDGRVAVAAGAPGPGTTVARLAGDHGSSAVEHRCDRWVFWGYWPGTGPGSGAGHAGRRRHADGVPRLRAGRNPRRVDFPPAARATALCLSVVSLRRAVLVPVDLFSPPSRCSSHFRVRRDAVGHRLVVCGQSPGRLALADWLGAVSISCQSCAASCRTATWRSARFGPSCCLGAWAASPTAPRPPWMPALSTVGTLLTDSGSPGRWFECGPEKTAGREGLALRFVRSAWCLSWSRVSCASWSRSRPSATSRT